MQHRQTDTLLKDFNALLIFNGFVSVIKNHLVPVTILQLSVPINNRLGLIIEETL